MKTLTLTEAAVYQDSFDAVAAGSPTLAQAQEVEAVMAGLDHLRPIGAAASALVDRYTNILGTLPEEKRVAVVEAIDGKNAASPRITIEFIKEEIVEAPVEPDVPSEPETPAEAEPLVP